MPKTGDARFEPLERTIDERLYEEIKALWLMHVTEEEKLFAPHSEEDGERALEQALTAFTDDCVMEVKQSGDRFTGQEARATSTRRRSSPRSRACNGSPRPS